MSSFEDEMKGRESLLDAVDFEPPKGKRSYYKHNATGQRAFMVRKGGQTRLKLDHGVDAAVVELNPSQWTPDSEDLPLLPAHVDLVTFEADKAYCSQIGMYQRSRQEWRQLTTEQRAGWSRMGPPDTDTRRRGMYLVLRYFLGSTEQEQIDLLKFIQAEQEGF